MFLPYMGLDEGGENLRDDEGQHKIDLPIIGTLFRNLHRRIAYVIQTFRRMEQALVDAYTI